jgi:penicillin amidase
VVLAAVVVLAGIFILNVALGMRAHARYSGTISGLALQAPVSVLRDDRGVPHIIARNQHDLFFAEGYVEGSDRLFQMDLARRFVEGRLAEIFGRSALPSDERERSIPVHRIVEAQWRRLGPRSRLILGAFSDGVNAAIEREPLPVEFRILAYHPQPWTPQDSLAIGVAETLDLIDDWNAIEPRDRAFRLGGDKLLDREFPLSDPCYDAPVTLGLRGMAPGPACTKRASLLRELRHPRAPIGSNEWAAGAARTNQRRALLANDPHLDLAIPGIWYLVDLRAPGFHAAGATFGGEPGVILGHNQRIAWGITDGTVTSLSVFDPPRRLDPRGWHTETIGVRFGAAVTQRYYRTARDFGVTTARGTFVLVRWPAYERPVFAGTTFFDLDRAGSVGAALAAISHFQGPDSNFVVAGTSGRVAYALAGPVPDDPVWARHFHPAADLGRSYPDIPFAALPHVAPSRTAVVWTANNQMYGAGYPLRLSPQFAPPYRAYRIAQLLRARKTYDVGYFTRMQLDVLSLPERELARRLSPLLERQNPNAASMLAGWDGLMTGDSRAATLAQALRVRLTGGKKGRMPNVLMIARSAPQKLQPGELSSPEPWSIAGAAAVVHPLSRLGIDFLNGVTLPGNGDAYTIRMQEGNHSQSFRAVWDVGDWDAGGITLPEGESGEPGSGHYTDQAAAWIGGRLWPLPFSRTAVERTAVERETLAP